MKIVAIVGILIGMPTEKLQIFQISKPLKYKYLRIRALQKYKKVQCL